MPIEIKNASTLVSPWSHWFFLGPTGSGKTTIASSFPYPFFIVPKVEQSIITLRGTDVDYVEVDSRSDMGDAISYLERGYAASAKAISEGDNDRAWAAFPYQTVVIESVSHFADVVIEEIGRERPKGMDQAGWGVFAGYLRTLHARLRRLPVHVVFTALATVKESEHGGRPQGGPLLSGSMAFKLPSACDAIGYCEVVGGAKGSTYRVHFAPYKNFDARVRVPRHMGAFPSAIDDFTWEKARPWFDQSA